MASISRYDFEDKVLSALKNRDGVGTVGDISADTGLEYHKTESALRNLLTVYKSHLDVDEDGNLLYQFEPEFIRRGEDKKRLWYDIKQAAWSVTKKVFKVWIMVMLVGYVAAFVVLLVALAVGAIAAAMSSESDEIGELAFIPFRLLARLLEFMFWIDFYGDSSGRRKRKKKKVDKPFYQKTFDFVFGPEQNRDPLAIQKKFTAFVRYNDGQVTAADWAAISGQSLNDAETAMTASVVRYNGEVDFTEKGTLIYKFEELLLSANQEGTHVKRPRPIWTQKAKLKSLTQNPKTTNQWIFAFNAFIMAVSTGVLFNAAGIGAAATIGLGFIPLIFSILFFSFPLYRWFQHKGMKSKIEKENRRRENIKRIYNAAEKGEVLALHDVQLADDFKGEMVSGKETHHEYEFDIIVDSLADGNEARSAKSLHQTFGVRVFSSNEETTSLSDYDMEDFDRRLAAELEGSEMEIEIQEEVHAY